MTRLATRLRVGEKIGLGFGLVGLILLGVIGYYDLNLRGVTTDFTKLSEVVGARLVKAFEIESRLAAMRGAQERFILTRDPAYAEETRSQAEQLLERAGALAAIDEESRLTAAAIQARTNEFIARFDAIVAAWETKGLDEVSGLQGAFRRAVHELQERSRDYQVDRPYLLLLQVRRGEKDLALRREAEYQTKVETLLDELAATVAASELPESVQEQLAGELETYRSAFTLYAERILAGEDPAGGKGEFRDAAHRFESILNAHYVPFIETLILEMRRREKDYLLRGEEATYVPMVQQLAAGIRGQIQDSLISPADKAVLAGLLETYEHDFLALVEQDRLIAALTLEMDAARALITPLVETNLERAHERMAETSALISATSAERARLSLMIALGAALLSVLLAVMIITRIVRPVRTMAGLLEELTHRNPSERIAVDPAGRDEINAMGIALNTLADHRANFYHWWRSSMQEAIALRDLNTGTTSAEQTEAVAELRTALLAQLQQLNAINGQMQQHAQTIEELAEQVGHEQRGRLTPDDAKALRTAAAEIASLLSVIDAHSASAATP